MNVMRTQNNHSRSFSGSGQQRPDMYTVHTPVLLQQVLKNLHPKHGDIVLDCTLGGGGHASEIAKCIGSSGTLIGIDADSNAIRRVQYALELLDDSNIKLPKLYFMQENFRNLDNVLNTFGITEINSALFDLGLSSDQLEVSGRGFTFQNEETLTMTLSDVIGKETLTAKDIVNEWQEESIADVIYGYGGERYARRIAKAIVQARAHGEIVTTGQLVEIIKRSVPKYYRHGKTHPATKTFQALRITVNDELGAVKEALGKVLRYVMPGGRIAVITFHSLEDKLVKQLFREWNNADKGKIITKRPILPTKEEISQNRRSRSGKLRVFEKSN